MNTFLRNQITIRGNELHERIVNWIGMKDKSLSVFCHMLSSIGIVFPVTLAKNNQNTCVCTTGDGRLLTMSFVFKALDEYHELHISEGNRHYVYLYKDSCFSPCLKLVSTFTQKDSTTLYSHYENSICFWTVDLHDNIHIEICISEHKLCINDFDNSKHKMEDFLVNLTFPCTAQEIYEEILQTFSFKAPTVFCIPDINVKVQETLISRKRRTLSAVNSVNGRKVLYVINEGRVSYGISKSGTWFYTTPDVSCTYSSRKSHVSVSFADETKSCDYDITDIVTMATKKVNTIRGQID